MHAHTQVRCGSANFKSGHRILSDVCSLHPSFRGIHQECSKALARYQEHCKSGLATHLNTTSSCASHCLVHLLGGQGAHSIPCTHEHTVHCKECDYGRVFVKTLRNMVSRLENESLLQGEALVDMRWRISDFERKHDTYVAHLIRGYHEINQKNQVRTLASHLRTHRTCTHQ